MAGKPKKTTNQFKQEVPIKNKIYVRDSLKELLKYELKKELLIYRYGKEVPWEK